MMLKLMTSQGKEEKALCAPQEASTEAACTEAKVLCAPQEAIREAPCTEEEALRNSEALRAPQETIRQAPCTEKEALCTSQATAVETLRAGESALCALQGGHIVGSGGNSARSACMKTQAAQTAPVRKRKSSSAAGQPAGNVKRSSNTFLRQTKEAPK